MTRQEAREFLMKIIFQMESNDDFKEESILKYLKQENNRGQELYLSSKLKYLCQHKDEIDEEINKYANKWTTKRMAKVDLAILRLAVTELKGDDIPVSVTINEAVELAKKYSEEKSASFINGILSKIEHE
ncbi:MAG: transcription antitermination factor NusB [Clostridia bacterium]|nr:transcription antitermination factor NusB [Clostridia bacterium]